MRLVLRYLAPAAVLVLCAGSDIARADEPTQKTLAQAGKSSTNEAAAAINEGRTANLGSVFTTGFSGKQF